MAANIIPQRNALLLQVPPLWDIFKTRFLLHKRIHSSVKQLHLHLDIKIDITAICAS
jgi:hypothetical protein